MESYRRDTSAFKVCEDHPRLIFKEVGSYISVNAKTFTRYPFKCKDSLTKYGNILRGPYFYFIQTIPILEDAYCIYAGDKCLYDNQIEFLTDIANRKQKHQFIVAGHMFILSYRISNDSIPSTPVTHGPILIVGPLAAREVTLSKALEVVSGPFETTAWIFITIMLLTFVIVRIEIAFTFTYPLRLVPFWWNVWGEYAAAKQPKQSENVQNNPRN